MPYKASVKAAGKCSPHVDTFCGRCHLRDREISRPAAPDIRPGARPACVRDEWARRDHDLPGVNPGIPPGRLFPPLRAAAFATADVRRAVPGMSVGILAVIAVLLAVTALLLAPAAPARADAGPGGVDVPDSPIGDGSTTPISPADRDFVVRVRLAGLWEIPAGQMAAQKGVDPHVRQVGKEIAAQHVRLDALTRAAAARVRVALPDRPLYE